MNLESAIAAHADWKTKLRAAIQKKEQLDAGVIAMDNQCPLGKWLHGEGKGQYGRFASFARCVDKHAEFHKSAGNVAKVINMGKYSEAEAMLGSGTPYVEASSAVAVAIIGLRKEAGI